MSRPWPLLVVTKCGTVHISDAQSGKDGLGFECRCGKDLGYSSNDIHPLTMRSEREGACREFRDGPSGSDRICRRCGDAADFDAAVEKYRAEQLKWREGRKLLDARRRRICDAFAARARDVFRRLVTEQLEEFPCAEDGERLELAFWVDDMKFTVSPANIAELCDAAEAAEEEAAH